MAIQEFAHAQSPDAATAQLKVPPNSVAAAQALLGGLKHATGAWDDNAALVSEDDLYRRDHRLIFTASSQLAALGSPFDVITVSEKLEGDSALASAGGLAYLGLLAKNTPSAANIKAYAAIVRDHSVARQLIHVGTQVSADAFNRDGRTTAEQHEYADQMEFDNAEQGARGRRG